jgi:hypothetical protein
MKTQAKRHSVRNSNEIVAGVRSISFLEIVALHTISSVMPQLWGNSLASLPSEDRPGR